MNEQKTTEEPTSAPPSGPQEKGEKSSKQPRPPVAVAVARYVAALRGIGQTAAIALPHIAKWTLDEMETTQKKIEGFVPEPPKKGDPPVTLEFESIPRFVEFTDAIRRIEELQQLKATAILSKSLFTQLFAEYDAFIGELLKSIYLKNDFLLKGIAREISLPELLEHKDLDSAKRAMLDKEIETFRRDSYVEQFSSLEKKFNLPLRKFREWPAFVELSQRRNILTHNGGLVSDQYLVVCDREGHAFEERPAVGSDLQVSFEYFARALRLLTKVGLMLGYTLWNKVFPKEADTLHNELNEMIFQSLRQKRWALVADLTDFVLNDAMKKGISDVDLRIRVVNSAIGLKFAGKDVDARRLLNSIDWSASYRDFKLALAVLEERFDEAISIMKSIGKRGEIVDQHGYHTWPLFWKFRERADFYAAYLEIYDQPFAERLETPDGSLEAHAARPTEGQIVDVQVREIANTELRSDHPQKKRQRVSRRKELPLDRPDVPNSAS